MRIEERGSRIAHKLSSILNPRFCIFGSLCLCALVVILPVLLLAGKEPPAAPVNINSATEEQLQALPGIGPAMARRIARYRRRNGPFRRLEELLIIRGMSKQKLARLRPYLKI